jgi:hypothetical protein
LLRRTKKLLAVGLFGNTINSVPVFNCHGQFGGHIAVFFFLVNADRAEQNRTKPGLGLGLKCPCLSVPNP